MKQNPYSELITLGFLDNCIIPLVEDMKKFNVADIQGKTADETHFKLGEVKGRIETLDNFLRTIRRKADGDNTDREL